MAFPPERPAADPLLEPATGALDVVDAPLPTTVGNSFRTLLLVGLLAVLATGIWWLRRPTDLSERLAGREWVIVTVDDRPATDELGRVATFVLDGTHAFGWRESCRSQSGTWSFDTSAQRLELDRRDTTPAACPAEPPPHTIGIASGTVTLDGGELTLDTGSSVFRAIAPDDHGPATVDELAGRWTMGTMPVDFGPRGLLRVGECSGSWRPAGAGISISFDRDAIESGACPTDAVWTPDEVVLATRFGDVLLLRPDRSSNLRGGELRRLDIMEPNGSPRLDVP